MSRSLGYDHLRRLVLPVPWTFVAVAAITTFLHFNPELRTAWLYHREGILSGQWWRLWSGHVVHFGLPHYLADTALFLLIGRFLEAGHPVASRVSLLLAPVVISAVILFFDPQMITYGGLSALNVAFLVFLSCERWHRQRTDWFWPALLLVHGLELGFEALQGGRGGGMIAFDDPAVRVATIAHLGGVGYGILWWLVVLASARWHTKPVRL